MAAVASPVRKRPRGCSSTRPQRAILDRCKSAGVRGIGPPIRTSPPRQHSLVALYQFPIALPTTAEDSPVSGVSAMASSNVIGTGGQAVTTPSGATKWTAAQTSTGLLHW